MIGEYPEYTLIKLVYCKTIMMVHNFTFFTILYVKHKKYNPFIHLYSIIAMHVTINELSIHYIINFIYHCSSICEISIGRV